MKLKRTSLFALLILALAITTPAFAETIALLADRVIDARSDRALENAAVVIEGEKITFVGDRDELPVLGGLPVGHGVGQLTVGVGVPATLDATAGTALRDPVAENDVGYEQRPVQERPEQVAEHVVDDLGMTGGGDVERAVAAAAGIVGRQIAPGAERRRSTARRPDGDRACH